MDNLMDLVMEDAIDDIVDEVIGEDEDNPEIELPPEEDGIFADTPAGIEYDDEEEEYEDPYIIYDVEVEEEEPDEDDEEEEDYDEDDFFVQESFAYNPKYTFNEAAFTKSVLELLTEAETDEDKEAAAKKKADEMIKKLHMYQSKGHKAWKDSVEGQKSKDAMVASTLISGFFTAAGAVCLALGGAALPEVAIFTAILSTFNIGTNIGVNKLNKKYARKYSDSDKAKIKHYIDKANKCAEALEKKAKDEENKNKKSKYEKTAKEYRDLVKKFESELELATQPEAE